MGLKSVTHGQVLCVMHHFLRCLLTSFPACLVRIAEKQIGSKGHFFPEGASQEIAGTDAQFFSDNIDAREFQRSMQLGPIIIKRSGRIAYFPVKRFKLHGIVPQQVFFQFPEGDHRRFSSAPHLSESGNTLIGLDLHDGSDKSPPMAPVRVTQGCLQRDCHRSGPNICDFH